MTADTLRAARALVEQGWTQSGYYAVDADGESVAPCDPAAVAWDLIGACEAASGKTRRVVCDMALWLFPRGRTNVAWNDDPNTTLTDVLAAFDHAIAVAEGDLAW